MKAPETAPAVIAPHTQPQGGIKPMLPVGRDARETLEMVGLAAVCDLVMEGHSQKRIAAMLGVSQSSLAGWLANQRGDNAALYSESLRASAESLVDQARAVLESAGETTASVMKCRAIADLMVRQAGIRHRAYRDRIDAGTLLVDSVSDRPSAAIVPTFRIVIANEARPEERLIEPDDG